VSAESIPPTPPFALESGRERGKISVSRRRVRDAVCVALFGELDLTGAPITSDQVRQAQDESSEVLLDLRGLTFMDASGLNMIVAADTRARQHRGRLSVLCGRSCVRRVFELTAAHRSLELVDADLTASPVTAHRPREPFRLEIVDERDRVRVAPVGELDLATAEPLAQAIRELRGLGVTHLILDLRRVSFMDSSGLRVALDLHTEATGNGLRLELLPGPPHVQRIFELTGTHDQLPFATPEPPENDRRTR
jgi:anti-sigma B factor antagonist